MSKKSAAVGPRVDQLLSAAAAVTAAATGTGVIGPANTAEADVIHSGAVNIVIPDNFDGIYMNLITGVTGASAGAVPGWDINPYSSSGTPNTTFNLFTPAATVPGSGWLVTGNGQFVNTVGTPVNGTQTFGTPGGPTNLAGQVTLNADNYFGVQFLNEGTSTTNFGWIKINFGAAVGTRAITEFAYENAGASINIGQITAVPEPSTFALLATGATGLIALRRRRRAA
jgi:hypothetical protein